MTESAEAPKSDVTPAGGHFCGAQGPGPASFTHSKFNRALFNDRFRAFSHYWQVIRWSRERLLRTEPEQAKRMSNAARIIVACQLVTPNLTSWSASVSPFPDSSSSGSRRLDYKEALLA
jgi:hypothetical protein